MAADGFTPMTGPSNKVRLDSPSFLAAHWVTMVAMPAALGLGMLTMSAEVFTEPPSSKGEGLVFIAFLIAFVLMAAGSTHFLKTFSSRVFMERESGTLIVSGRSCPVDGKEVFKMVNYPNLKFMEIVLHDGSRVRFISQFLLYFDIKKEGPQDWWANLTQPAMPPR